jgi:hypothetical protein
MFTANPRTAPRSSGLPWSATRLGRSGRPRCATHSRWPRSDILTQPTSTRPKPGSAKREEHPDGRMRHVGPPQLHMSQGRSAGRPRGGPQGDPKDATRLGAPLRIAPHGSPSGSFADGSLPASSLPMLNTRPTALFIMRTRQWVFIKILSQEKTNYVHRD